jgi:DNA primase
MLPAHILTWFKERKITEATLEKFSISWNGTHIVIPIKNSDGKVLFNKYRRDPAVSDGPKYKYQFGSKNTLFNFNPDWDEVIICEGELDAMFLDQMDFNACTGTGGAGSFPESWQSIFKGKEVFVCMDNDEAGTKGAVRIATLMPEDVKIIPFPRYFTGKDVTELICKFGVKKFEDLKKNAYHLSLPCESIEDIKKELNYCVQLRRSLISRDLSSTVIDEYVEQLNAKKRTLMRQKAKVEYDNTLESLKKIPISNFIEFKSRFATCLFHSGDRTPSMYYYPEDNHVYCYACQARKDVVDIVMALNKCSFTEAVKILKKNTL